MFWSSSCLLPRPTPEDPIAVPHEPFHLESWIADQPSGSHAVFDSEFVMHVHKGPCEVPAQVSASSDSVPLEHGVGAVGAEESFVYQISGSSELIQAENCVGDPILPLRTGDMTLVEVCTHIRHALGSHARMGLRPINLHCIVFFVRSHLVHLCK